MRAPLYVKYETEKTRYLFDAATGRIVEVDPIIYAIVDDMDVFTDDEIVDEYPQFDEKEIRTALSELRELQSQGYLRPHLPKELSSVERVVYDRTLYRIGDFWPKRSMLLILGTTERCNLCCDYCCYSGKFEGQRTHSSKTMSWEIAQKAISYYLENEQVGDGTYPITFYGGEPLLEFKLLRKCVLYAEELAASRGKQVRFAITTNGTLLSDEAADFLAEHDFMILISMDGPKESHDRYRIFVNGEGSFEIVKRNLQRFAERHPGYVNRGLSVTLRSVRNRTLIVSPKNVYSFSNGFFVPKAIRNRRLSSSGISFSFGFSIGFRETWVGAIMMKDGSESRSSVRRIFNHFPLPAPDERFRLCKSHDLFGRFPPGMEELITQRVEGFIRGYAVRSVRVDEKDSAVYVTISVNGKTLGKHARPVPAVIEAEDIKTGLNQAFDEIQKG